MTSIPLVSDLHGRVASQPQVVEREGEFGFEWLVSWKPPRLSLQRVQCVCFAAAVSMGEPDASLQPVVAVSPPHCVTFVIVPDPAPLWTATSLQLAPMRIVMGTTVVLQLHATDDNPDDHIQLEILTSPVDTPSFVKIAPCAKFASIIKHHLCPPKHSSTNFVTLLTLFPRCSLRHLLVPASHHEWPSYATIMETRPNRLRPHFFFSSTRGWRSKLHVVFQSRGFCRSASASASVAGTSGDGCGAVHSRCGCQLHLQVRAILLRCGYFVSEIVCLCSFCFFTLSIS